MKIGVTLDTRARKTDGTFPVKISVALHGTRAFIPLDVSVTREQWRGGRVVQHQNADRLNNYIGQRFLEVQTAFLELRTAGAFKGMRTAAQAKDAIIARLHPDEDKPVTFAEWYKTFADLHTNARTHDIYIRTWNWVERFDAHAHELQFTDITKAWLERFFVFMAERSPSINARNIHLRNIRAVFNDALDNELTTFYPFRRLKIRPQATAKRNLSPEELRHIFTADVPNWQRKYIDAFRLSFYLIGINMADLLALTPDNVQQGRIVYTRRKTHRLYSIKIEPEAQAILDTYKGERLLLSWAENCEDYRHFANRCNHNLGTIRAGLTTYWARHSWATIAASLDIPEDTIALALGHSSAHTTTAIYIERRLSKVDAANRKVLDLFL